MKQLTPEEEIEQARWARDAKGRILRAMATLEGVASRAMSSGNKQIACTALSEIAICHQQLYERGSRLQLNLMHTAINRGMEYIEHCGGPETLKHPFLYHSGTYWFYCGEYNKAIACFSSAIHQAEQANHYLDLPEYRSSLGCTLEMAGHSTGLAMLDKALKELKLHREEYTDLDYRVKELGCHLKLTLVFHKRSDTRNMEESLKTAMRLCDKIEREYGRDHRRKQLARVMSIVRQ